MGNEIDADAAARIDRLIAQAADSLSMSLRLYWPANDRNDPAERNVSLHFAHAMLSNGFACFAEADHPDRENVLGIDVFGIEPNRSWFLGCEFKRLYNSNQLLSMAYDITRLRSFWLRTEFRPEVWGDMYANAPNCGIGYGLVGGLHWVGGSRPSSTLLDLWRNTSSGPHAGAYELAGKHLQEVRAAMADPKEVVRCPNGGRYFLLTAYFPIERAYAEARTVAEVSGVRNEQR